MKLLHITLKDARCLEPEYFRQKLREFGELTVLPGERMTPEQIAAHVREHDVYLAGWDSVMLPCELAENHGKLRYICGLTGTMRAFVPIELVEAGIPLTNWGDAPAWEVAEGAMLLLLASLKTLHRRIMFHRAGGYWNPPPGCGGSLYELNVGVYGCGLIGQRFIEMLKPFGPIIRIFDPYLQQLPEGCQRVASLDELFSQSEAIAIHASLTDQTRNSVTARHLAMLPDNAVIVNTARGGIIDQEALFRELETGRLRAGLDVLEPDYLPEDHPARKWENLIITGHSIQHGPPFDPARPRLERRHKVALENLRRFRDGEPLLWVMDAERYRRST